MSSTVPPTLYCPEQGCTFSYGQDQVNALKTHKAKVHVMSVKVAYINPAEEVVLYRTGLTFLCQRCEFSSPYPSTVQKHTKICTPVHPQPQPQPSPQPQSQPSSQPPVLRQSPTPEIIKGPLSPSPVSRSCSPFQFPILLDADYAPFPDDRTVVDHPPFNLPSLGVVINQHLRCLICIYCERGIDPSKLIEHVRKDLPLVEVPDELPHILETSYRLVSYSSVEITSGPISPVFGLPLYRHPLFFCDCGKGYNSYENLRTHQTREGNRKCPLKGKNPLFHRGYGQRLAGNRSYFEVDPRKWLKDPEDQSQYSFAFSRSLPPLRDYSTMKIEGAEDDMNTSSFFYKQRWLFHLKDYTPVDIQEVLKKSSPDAPFGEGLLQVGVEFLKLANNRIKNYQSFGLLNMMGQTTERDTIHRFDPVSEATVEKYARTLHVLIFGIMRQLDPSYSHRYRYPSLHETQIRPFQNLRTALDEGLPINDLIPLYQRACFLLFAHHQHQYPTSRDLDQFFSPVICFLVLSSVHEKGGFRLPSLITQTIAHVMFSIRGTVLFEIIDKARKDVISVSEAYSLFKQYLMNGHETPMAYYYNTLTLLAVIRTDETNEASFTCTDERGMEFSYQGSLLKVRDITKMINELYDRYKSLTRSQIFFGEPTPDSLSLVVDIRGIIDNLQNKQPGYSFIDDPRNPFHSYRSAYGEWLLSDPVRASRFAYIHNDRLIWKPRASIELLQQMEEIRLILLLLCIFSAGPSSRATEVARQLLRNLPGSSRNLYILFHVLCVVDIQDKTSHKRLRDKYVPHCPALNVADLLVYNLAVFRPFEEYLVQSILGDEVGLRYHHQLWPGLKETITDTRVSDAIGRECSRHLLSSSTISKVSYKILFWRNFVSAILNYRSDVNVKATHQQYYADTAMMHTSTIAVSRYGGSTNNLPMSDPRQIVECIKLGLAWHDILSIGKQVSVVRDLDEELENIETIPSETNTMQMTSVALNNLSNKIIDIVGARLEGIVQETVMNAVAEMSMKYFPKVLPNPNTDTLHISSIAIPPCRLQQLRSFLRNPQAQFSCPEQAVLLELMLQRTQSLLAVLGTGTGKTLTILLQASIQSNLVTFVVLPLSSLHEDLKRRAGEHGVMYARWSPNGKFNPNAQVISVSIEHLGFKDFSRFLGDLENMGRLGPLIFDEIHKMITDSSYREAFVNFHKLNKVKAVIFGLTGSLPPSLYPVLCDLTLMSWKIIRTPSTRKELKYQVKRVQSEQEMDISIVTHLRQAISTYQKDDRAIVFCRSRAQATTLADLFEIHPYLAPGDDENLLERNTLTMIKWISGENQVMASTSILGCGFDYAHIRDVVHRDPSFTMLDQYQEDSRGGRDGVECRATTFFVDNKKYSIPDGAYDLGSQVLFDSLDDSESCRRIAPGIYLDGQAIQCVSLPGARFCDNCERGASKQVTASLPQSVFSTNHKTFEPPTRSSDVFDGSPRRVDLREHLRGIKRKRSSMESRDSVPSPAGGSSPNKHVRFSSPSTLRHKSPFKRTLPTPESPPVFRPLYPSSTPTPAPSVQRPVVSSRRILRQPAGISARQDQMATRQRDERYKSSVVDRLIRALDFFQDKCIICFMYGKSKWEQHKSDNCPGQVGTNRRDKEYGLFRSNGIKLAPGWCFSCLIYQKWDEHPFVDARNCRWSGIIFRALYSFTISGISCPFIPEDLNVTDTKQFCTWASTNPGDFAPFPFHNGLKLFLWMVYDYFELNYDSMQSNR